MNTKTLVQCFKYFRVLESRVGAGDWSCTTARIRIEKLPSASHGTAIKTVDTSCIIYNTVLKLGIVDLPILNK